MGCTGACNQQLAESNGVTCRYSCLMALVNIEGQVLGPPGWFARTFSGSAVIGEDSVRVRGKTCPYADEV